MNLHENKRHLRLLDDVLTMKENFFFIYPLDRRFSINIFEEVFLEFLHAQIFYGGMEFMPFREKLDNTFNSSFSLVFRTKTLNFIIPDFLTKAKFC